VQWLALLRVLGLRLAQSWLLSAPLRWLWPNYLTYWKSVYALTRIRYVDVFDGC